MHFAPVCKMFVILSRLGSEGSFYESNKRFAIRPLGEWRLRLTAYQGTFGKALGWVALAVGCCMVGLEGRAAAPGGVSSETEVWASGDSLFANSDGYSINGLWQENVASPVGQLFAENQAVLRAGVSDPININRVDSFDVVAIDQNDRIELNRTQSRSTNYESIVTIAESGGDTNDREFLFGSHNAGSNTFGVTDIPNEVDQRLGRVWVVQETGDVGNVDVSFDLSGSSLPSEIQVVDELFLLYDGDGVFAEGASLLTASSFANSVVTFRSVGQGILSDGQFFTMGIKDGDGPAGVLTGIELWLKADSGTSTSISGEALSVWNDQSGNSNHAISGLKAPTFLHDVAEHINFNPTIRFDEAEDQLNINVPGVDGSNEFSLYFVGIIEGVHVVPLYPSGLLATSLINSNSGTFFDYRHTSSMAEASLLYAITVVDLDHLYDEPALTPLLAWSMSMEEVGAERNGFTATNQILSSGLPGSSSYSLGRAPDPLGDLGLYYDGLISEVIFYSTNPSQSQKMRIHSYLAIKYGLSLGQNLAEQDYVDSSGVVIWDASAVNMTFDHDITAIGQDDLSGLNQTKSKSTNFESMVTIEESGEGMGDREFLFWSNDGGAKAFSTDDVPSGINQRIARKWFVQETGEVGAINLSFDLSTAAPPSEAMGAENFVLLMDDDGSFAAGGTGVGASSFDGNIASFMGVDEDLLDDNVYFSVGITGLNFDPVAGPDTSVRMPGTEGHKVSVAALLSNDTDANGDTLTFETAELPANSTNGSALTLISEGRWILYSPNESQPASDDTFSYQISDGNGGVATGMVTVQVEVPNTQSGNFTRASVNGNDIDVEFRGIPGRKYKIQSTTNLSGVVIWVDESVAITAGPRGQLILRDLGASSAHGSKFYRTIDADE